MPTFMDWAIESDPPLPMLPETSLTAKSVPSFAYIGACSPRDPRVSHRQRPPNFVHWVEVCGMRLGRERWKPKLFQFRFGFVRRHAAVLNGVGQFVLKVDNHVALACWAALAAQARVTVFESLPR